MGIFSWIKKHGNILFLAGALATSAGIMKANQEVVAHYDAKVTYTKKTTAMSKKNAEAMKRFERVVTNVFNIITESYNRIEDASKLEKLEETKAALKIYNEVLVDLKDVLEMIEDPDVFTKMQENRKIIGERLKGDMPDKSVEIEKITNKIESTMILLNTRREEFVEEIKVLIQKVEEKIEKYAI